MSTNATITIGGVNRKIGKAFLTVNGVYRKISKAFITVNGVYRKCFSEGKLEYVDVLSNTHYTYAATSIKALALFVGSNGSIAFFNNNLTMRSLPPYVNFRHGIEATSIDNYALFGGGNYSDIVDTFDNNLIHTLAPNLSEGRYRHTSTSLSNGYALFGGGEIGNGYNTNSVEAYDNYLTHTLLESLTSSVHDLKAETVGNYALFVGGWTGWNVPSGGDAYNHSLTKSNVSVGYYGANCASAVIGDYAIFMGGYNHNGDDFVRIDTVAAFNKSLTRIYLPSMSEIRDNMGATTLDEYAIFLGGRSDHGEYRPKGVEVYNKFLTKIPTADLSKGCVIDAATTIGNYALFASSEQASIFAYTYITN